MSTITAMPTAPTRTDPTTFSARADAWDAALVLLGPEINVVVGEINANAAAVATQTALAGVYAATASNAATAATAAATLVNVLPWVSGTYAVGDPRYSPLNMQTYRCKTAGVRATDPSLDLANWTLVTAMPDMVGQAGKVLGNNGTIPVWQLPIPDPTGNTLYTLASNGTSTPVWRPSVSNREVLSYTKGVTAITAGSVLVNYGIDATPISSCTLVTLPSASSYSAGEKLTVSLDYAYAGIVSYTLGLQTTSNVFMAQLDQYTRTAVLTSNSSTWTVDAGFMAKPLYLSQINIATYSYVTIGAYGVRACVKGWDGTTQSCQSFYVTAPRTVGGSITPTNLCSYSNNVPTPAYLTESLLMMVTSSGGSGNGIRCDTWTVSNGAATYGAGVNWDTAGNNIQASPSGLCRLSDTVALTTYGQASPSGNYACVITVSGTTPTANTRFVMPTTNRPTAIASFINVALSATSALTIAYYSNTQFVCVPVAISGTNLSFDSAWTSIGSRPDVLSNVSAVALDSTRVLVVWANSSDSNYLSGRIITVSGTTITQGTVTRLIAIANTTYGVGCALLPNGKLYALSGDKVITLTTSGSTITVVAGSMTVLPYNIVAHPASFAANNKGTGPNTIYFLTNATGNVYTMELA